MQKNFYIPKIAKLECSKNMTFHIRVCPYSVTYLYSIQ